MKRLKKWAGRAAILLVLLVAGLLAPIGYVETFCRGGAAAKPYSAILPPEHHRPETRTLMTYPEWHIVHAYDDYAEVIRTGDPHQFGFLSSIGGFWSSLCRLSEVASAHGEVDGPTKQMVYVIGVSFTVELLLKAAYEETIGRAFAWLRGSKRAALDELSATQAREYARFLQQVPWYKWRFREASGELQIAPGRQMRDSERRIAIGLEYSAKAVYADAIASAVANVGGDQLTLRMIVAGSDVARFSSYPAAKAIEVLPQGVVIETPRYRVLTHLLQKMAEDGLDFVEIAGNDEILFTLISSDPSEAGSVFSAARQGFGDYRHLVLVNVKDLAGHLRKHATSRARLEHVHDY